MLYSPSDIYRLEEGHGYFEDLQCRLTVQTASRWTLPPHAARASKPALPVGGDAFVGGALGKNYQSSLQALSSFKRCLLQALSISSAVYCKRCLLQTLFTQACRGRGRCLLLSPKCPRGYKPVLTTDSAALRQLPPFNCTRYYGRLLFSSFPGKEERVPCPSCEGGSRCSPLFLGRKRGHLAPRVRGAHLTWLFIVCSIRGHIEGVLPPYEDTRVIGR